MPSHDEVESLVIELEEQANEWREDWPEGGPPVHLVERAAKMLRELDDRSKGDRGKMERFYIALIHKERGSDFGVSFPEFPGCVTAGSSVEEAFRMAKEALAGHIETMIERGVEIPSPPVDLIATLSNYAKRGDCAPILVAVAAPH